MVNNFKTDGENINNEKANSFLDTNLQIRPLSKVGYTQKKVDYDIGSIKLINNELELEFRWGTAIIQKSREY
jgi:hypothetical protein